MQVTRSGRGAGVLGGDSWAWHPISLLWLPRAAGQSYGSAEGSALRFDGDVSNAPATNSAGPTRGAPRSLPVSSNFVLTTNLTGRWPLSPFY